ncbi:MAG: hypothetical protein A2855_00730 [Candidatus Liptonbacteria bacterium RIFCSPHIGHO2_01_FULL_57_28]|uniref:ATP-grasp domain-containing protein n=1 Tax=Candidatus Liptonbacteria bacterium RIFCSPHIGHO2_01_FULL_57_28 TaxID=1798647 RepID=A0A1G2CBK8_9BACT|nr:MAG: hypothetical protein A2855_00730 [Candidatus Liptonbacteria bacterium RIFCSPHIGHO2_01_FULL_57_28]
MAMKATCEECGMESVNHGLERFSLRVDSVFRKVFRPLDFAVNRIRPLFDAGIDAIFPVLAAGLVRFGLARRLDGPDARSSETAQALWAEAAARGIEMFEVRLFNLPRRSFVARHKGRTLAFEGLPRPARVQRSILWIDDKAEVKRRFQRAGFPVPNGRSVLSEKGALEVFSKLSKPVIVKPQEGSAGRHTAAHIENETELRAAYRSARLVAPSVVVEEELVGPVFRATLINGELAAVLQRDPPQVVGDGRSTVAELVARENKNPLRRGPVFAEIQLGSAAAKRELARQGLKPDSVPAAGHKVQFHFKVNWGVGGISYDVTPEIHPDNAKLFKSIGAYLGEDIVGIDFIIDDIRRSWEETPPCGVIECNSLPLIGNHHFPYKGEVRNVAGAVWDMVFPASA